MIARPEFRGTFFGQTLTQTVRVATGKRWPWTAPSGEVVWLPVKESRVVLVWSWDGEQWLPDEEWLAANAGPRAGAVLASKRDPVEAALAARAVEREHGLRRTHRRPPKVKTKMPKMDAFASIFRAKEKK